MRRTGLGLQLLSAGVLAITGCHSGPDKNRPPPQPEVFAVPPDDARFSQAIAYPKEVLNQVPKKKDTDTDGAPPQMMNQRQGGGYSPSQ